MSRMDFLYSRTSCGSHLLPSSLCALADFLGLLPRTQPTLASRGVGAAAGQARPAPAFGPGPPVCYDVTALAAVLASGQSHSPNPISPTPLPLLPQRPGSLPGGKGPEQNLKGWAKLRGPQSKG